MGQAGCGGSLGDEAEALLLRSARSQAWAWKRDQSLVRGTEFHPVESGVRSSSLTIALDYSVAAVPVRDGELP
jgi:hypothetical protein